MLCSQYANKKSLLSLMTDLPHNPLGLYSLSAVSVFVLSKKEGWLAIVSTLVLLVTCVLLAIQGTPSSVSTPSTSSTIQKAPPAKPKSRPPTHAKPISVKSSLRAEAEPFTARRQLQHCHVTTYRHMLTEAHAAPCPPWRKPPGLADPVAYQTSGPSIWTKGEGERVVAPIRNHPWKVAGSPEVNSNASDPATDLPVLMLLRRLRELEHTPEQATPDRKPAGKRVVAGVRECNRAVARGKALAVVVANDLSRSFEEPKLVALLQQADSLNVPVVKALTRAELGQTIAKDVTATVLVVLDVEGAEDTFGEFLHITDTGRAAPAAPAA